MKAIETELAGKGYRGTLFIYMIDASKNQLVWQGRGTGTINPDISAQKREQNINYAVKQIFVKYPPRS